MFESDNRSHSTHSTFREKTLEHIFVGECLRCLWLRGRRTAEVLYADVDGAGYDIVFDVDGVLRHIQLKSSHREAKTATQKVNKKLTKKPSGCVVWMKFDKDNLDLGPFLWFGGAPNQRLPDLSTFRDAKHTKGNARGKKLMRKDIVDVPKSRFSDFKTIDLLVEQLFGCHPRPCATTVRLSLCRRGPWR